MAGKCYPECPSYRKPARRRPTDTERLTWLLEHSGLKVWSHKREWFEFPITRFHIDRLMREEARRG